MSGLPVVHRERTDGLALGCPPQILTCHLIQPVEREWDPMGGSPGMSSGCLERALSVGSGWPSGDPLRLTGSGGGLCTHGERMRVIKQTYAEPTHQGRETGPATGATACWNWGMAALAGLSDRTSFLLTPEARAYVTAGRRLRDRVRWDIPLFFLILFLFSFYFILLLPKLSFLPSSSLRGL